METLNCNIVKVATRIVMRKGELYSYDPRSIQYVLINDEFYTIEEVYDYSVDKRNEKIYLYGFYGSYIVPCMATDGRKYLRSMPEEGMMDNILKLPRIDAKEYEMYVNTIKIDDLIKQFNNKYNYLYGLYDNVNGYDEAIEAFDLLLKENSLFKIIVKKFNDSRQDFIASDREAASFMFALRKLYPNMRFKLN